MYEYCHRGPVAVRPKTKEVMPRKITRRQLYHIFMEART